MRDRTLQRQRKQKDGGEGPTWSVSIFDERMVGVPHLPLYVLQELIGIQRGKGEKNISFGRLGGLPKHNIRPIFSNNEEKREKFW
jgi:hypothetical protein